MVQIRGEMGETVPAFLGRQHRSRGSADSGVSSQWRNVPHQWQLPQFHGGGEREEEKEVGLEGRSDGCRGVLRVETKFHDFFSSPD